MPPAIPADDDRALLHADCSRCAALCCVLPPFAASADFALDKPAGRPCPNLAADDRCGIHAQLPERGFRGCVAFDCFGAGQQVVQVTYGGRDPRGEPEALAVLDAMRGLSELLWYLAEALTRPAAAPLGAGLTALRDRVRGLRDAPPAELAVLDVGRLRREAGALLRDVGERVRSELPGPRRDHAGADLAGARLRRADLRAACLRGALLIGADLREADLRGADLLGADLRGADLRGADLRGVLFLTRPQVAAARTDGATRVPETVR
ncbi:pentapeptide repeat-containing protein [Trujillonella endophytica]|uniref:Pentapeptide repeat-containing protein n=1 Tax=Trujillonella endophytica TaxID=673521 RepID=A0A1H8PRJ1_9ACTN|nr:pentapeptide repeat-containing protein [Trujillella endophytica]SEO44629.1 Pentapeptide repeat-containing protein [Trujillella endophytica]